MTGVTTSHKPSLVGRTLDDRALDEALANAAAAPILFVASDFDGTLADIVERPDLATADEDDFEVLQALGAERRTYAAVVSGRPRSQLVALTSRWKNFLICGSHGAEPDPASGLEWNGPGENSLQPAIARAFDEIASAAPGAIVERKPFGVAIHYRACKPLIGAGLRAAALNIGTTAEGSLLDGDKVVEVVIPGTSKGLCVRMLRRRLGAAAVIFIGDDTTDETVFVDLKAPDVGVSIGPRETSAAFRTTDRSQVGHVLQRLLELRRASLARSGTAPITAHSLLSDQRAAALVDTHGRISWMCVPRLDSAAIFARLLDAGGGEFAIGPADGAGEGTQQYVGDSLVLRTSWEGLRVTDYLDCTGGRPFQRAGRCDLVRVIEGTRPATVRFAPRLDFSRLPTRLSAMEWGVRVDAAVDPIVLVSPGVKWTVLDDGRHQSAVATVDPSAGPVVLELRYGVGSPRPAVLEEAQRRSGTEKFWSGWAGTLQLPKTAREAVVRSAVTLKALVQGPTGAIAAAATTSLPEQLGGERNWDYRFCWPRDAALAAATLVRMGNTGVAMKLLDWLGEVVDRCESPERLRPIYTVGGSNLPPEGQVNELEGYDHSRPVRLGNAASEQVQLDVFGPIVDLVALLAERGAPVTPQYWRLVEQMVRAVDARWDEPDHGIWEFRARPRHHVHSKTMCWQAVDRAIRVAEFVRDRVPTGWLELRERIREDVLAKGYRKGGALGDGGAFVCAYDLPEPDASVLWVGLSGMVGPEDPRLASTVDWVLKKLGTPRGVYRYVFDDGLPGVEGVFHICTGWAVRALCLLKRYDEARKLFEVLLAARGPTGLLSEEAEVMSGAPLGNFPQAYSHLALIDAAFAMDGSDA